MRHALLALPAFALLLAVPAFAQEAAPTPAAPSELEQSGLTPPTVLSEGYSTRGEDTLVTQLLGQKVYSSTADDAGEIGTINDMVVTSGQGISAVVIGVGGFLGVGTKDVAIDFGQLEWAQRDDGSRRWVLETTTEALSAAPAFIWSDSEEANGPAMTPAEEQAQMEPGDPNAAPADPDLTTDQPDRPVITTPVDRATLTNLDGNGLTVDELRGTGVYGIGDEPIGSISDVVLTPAGTVDALIVDVGGFLGLGAKPVAVGFDDLAFSSDTSGARYLFINASREQLEAQTAYDPATYATDRANQRMVITP
jgi:sporulation protein YlmC with PRC-barrel domain